MRVTRVGGDVVAFFIGGLWCMAWALVGLFLDPRRWWAFSFVSPPLLLVVAAVLLSTALILWRRPGATAGIADWLQSSPPTRSALFFFLAIAGVIAALLWLFRMRLFLPPPDGLGDSLLIVEHVEIFSRTLGYVDSFDELLEYYLRSRLYLQCRESMACTVEQSYALINWLLFLPWSAMLWYFLRGRSRQEMLLGLALFVGAPALQFFAGYVENYTVATVAMSAVCMISARSVERSDAGWAGRNALWLAGLIFALGCLFHMAVATIGPALLALAWYKGEGKVGAMFRRAWAAGLASATLLLIVFIYFIFFHDPPVAAHASHAANPPLLSPAEFFSGRRLLQWINELTMASPSWPLLLATIALTPAGTLSGLPASFPRWLLRLLPNSPAEQVSLVALGGAIALALIWKPLLGYPADWDLKTLFQTPWQLFVFYRMKRLLDGQSVVARDFGRGVLLVALIVGPLATGGWILRNSRSTPESEAALARAHRNAAEVVSLAESDRRWSSLPDLARQRLYLQLRAFFGRTRLRLEAGLPAHLSPTEREELLAGVLQGEREFEVWIVLPAAEFEKRRQDLWERWAQINYRVNSGPVD